MVIILEWVEYYRIVTGVHEADQPRNQLKIIKK